MGQQGRAREPHCRATVRKNEVFKPLLPDGAYLSKSRQQRCSSDESLASTVIRILGSRGF